MISVNGGGGWENFTPSSMTWSLQDVSDSASGRTQDALMHKNLVAQKRKLEFTWAGLSQAEASRVLKAFNHEYLQIAYPDAMSGTTETRTFYVGDRSAPVWVWTVDKHIYTNVKFNVIER